MMIAWHYINCKQSRIQHSAHLNARRSYWDYRYQWLNHYALFSGGYREDALDCMESLVQKYGNTDEEDSSSS